MRNFLKIRSRRIYLIPILVVTFIAIYPQLNLWIARGSQWQGAYYVSNYDETAYSAYVNALAGGKPRKNDPFLGIDHADHESFYSVQFIPAYAVAAPARWLGLSTSSAFIILNLLIAISSSAAMFWLLRSMTGNDLLSAAGTLVVLCLGTAAAYEGELRHWIEGPIVVDYLPFLRRYQPGLSFPVFFLFCGAVWKSFGAGSLRRACLYSTAAGILIATLIFSYFFLWTAALAWLGILVAVHLALTRSAWARVFTTAGIVAAFAVAALVPYFILLGDRATNLDSVQLLSQTHRPDLASSSVIFGLLVVAAVLIMWRRGVISLREKLPVFTFAFALTPVVLLNQQVITGRSLQPVHYEIFISNYLALFSIVLLAALARPLFINSGRERAFSRAVVYVAVIAAAWGIVEAAGSTSRNLFLAEIRDQAIPAIRFVDRQGRSDGPSAVLAPDVVTADFIPTVSTLRPLWNPHTSSAGGISVAENKNLFYQYLYYSGYTEKDLAEALRMNVFEATAAVFGSERALPELGGGTTEISGREIDAEAAQYRSFIEHFDAPLSHDPPLSYIIVAADAEPDLSRVDRWYLRERLGDFGIFRVYKLTPR